MKPTSSGVALDANADLFVADSGRARVDGDTFAGTPTATITSPAQQNIPPGAGGIHPPALGSDDSEHRHAPG